MNLNGKVALITGAGEGIGRSAAELLAREGAAVGVLSRTAEEVEEVADEISKANGRAMPLVADVSDMDAMEAATNSLAEKFGRLDIVFANAGVNGVWAPVTELKLEEWESTIRINLTGTFITIKAALPHLLKNGGSVIVTASVNGTRMFSNSGASAYATSKAGQVALTKMLALELARHRIRVNVICPGAIQTHIDQNTERRDLKEAQEPVEFPEGTVPLTGGRPGTPEQVAKLVLFLASGDSDHITGTEVWIDGAQSLLQG